MTRILRQARARRSISDIPGADQRFGTGGAARRGLTQGETAKIIGVSRRWYARLENAHSENYSDNMLEATRRTLDLSDTEFEIVYRAVRGTAPASAPEAAEGELSRPMSDLVRSWRPWGAYISDHRWDVLAYNAASLDFFPWMLHGLNVMEWALTWPEARTQLIAWETDWALPMMAQLRLHAEQWPSDDRLGEVLERVHADPIARGLWKSANLPVIAHPASDQTRRLYLPRRHRPSEIRLTPFTPMEMPWARLTVIQPV